MWKIWSSNRMLSILIFLVTLLTTDSSMKEQRSRFELFYFLIEIILFYFPFYWTFILRSCKNGILVWKTMSNSITLATNKQNLMNLNFCWKFPPLIQPISRFVWVYENLTVSSFETDIKSRAFVAPFFIKVEGKNNGTQIYLMTILRTKVRTMKRCYDRQ